MTFQDIFNASLPVFLMILVGSALRCLNVVKEDAEKTLMRVVVNLLYPCFILAKIPGNVALKNPANVASALTAGFGLTLTGLLVAYLIGIALRLEPGKTRNTFCLSAAIQNYGFIPIALIEGLFSAQSDSALGILFVHNLGLELAMWTVGIVIVSGSTAGMARRLLNGPTIAIVAGLILNSTGTFNYIPTPINGAIAQMGNCAIPISLLLVGAALAGVLITEKWQTNWSVVFGCLLVRFTVMPMILLSVAYLLPTDSLLRLVLLIESAMPAAVFPIVIAKHFGGHPKIAVQVTVVTTIASLILTPLIIYLVLSPSP